MMANNHASSVGSKVKNAQLHIGCDINLHIDIYSFNSNLSLAETDAWRYTQDDIQALNQNKPSLRRGWGRLPSEQGGVGGGKPEVPKRKTEGT